jgi:hypothetical protein
MVLYEPLVARAARLAGGGGQGDVVKTVRPAQDD